MPAALGDAPGLNWRTAIPRASCSDNAWWPTRTRRLLPIVASNIQDRKKARQKLAQALSASMTMYPTSTSLSESGTSSAFVRRCFNRPRRLSKRTRSVLRFLLRVTKPRNRLIETSRQIGFCVDLFCLSPFHTQIQTLPSVGSRMGVPMRRSKC